MENNSIFSIDFPANQHSVLYVLDGEVFINEQEVVSQYQFVVFEQTQGTIHITATANAKLLLMSGDPISEPLISYGPFVMTSQTEIMEALRDYQQGKMGFLY
jgi:redox-sensitive bicupin YhaK (pirin superfamily)